MIINHSSIPTEERMKGMVQFWKNSSLFQTINLTISKSFRRKLENDQFTILSSNCIAGVIYHRLGKKFLTPTINMFFSQPDFVEFCLHLEFYLEQELGFIETNESYPVAELRGDDKDIPTIRLNFNHDKVPETAIENWEKRKRRIRMDNLYVILYNLDGLTLEQLKRLDQFPCKGKVVLTAVPLPEIPWSVQIKPIPTHRFPMNYLEQDVFGVRYFEKKFDFVAFLNDQIERFK